MRKDKLRRRLIVGVLAAAFGAAVIGFGSGTARTQEVEWNAPQTTLTIEPLIDVAPPAPTGREENREVEWN